MRPRGEIRATLQATADEWVANQGLPADEVQGVTWRKLCELACVGYALGRATVKNMVQAGELVPRGEVAVPGSRRRMVAYVPGHVACAEPADLVDVLHGWGRD
jgi:hypothetical protein